jgi:transcription initiation factor TFIID subunit 5
MKKDEKSFELKQNVSDSKIQIENTTIKLNFGENPNPPSAYDEIIKNHRSFKLVGHTGSVFSLSISPDKKYLVSGSYDETIRLWNFVTRNTLVIFKGHFSPVLCVKFSPFSHYFASGGSDRTAKLWSVNNPGPLRVLVGHLSDVEMIDFHPNSFYLVTAANDRTIRLWSLASGTCVRVFFNTNATYIDCLSFSNSGKILAVGSKFD